MKATFRKGERLTSKKDITHLFNKGNSFKEFPFRVLWQLTEQKDKFSVKIAFSVSKKNFKRAVDRNYIKRRMREAYRTQKSELVQRIQNRDINIQIFIIYQDRNTRLSNFHDHMNNTLTRLISEIEK